MLKNYIAALAILTLAGCQSTESENTMAENDQNQQVEAEGEWISLFDGKTTNGWHTYGKDSVGRAWVIDDGALHLDASNKKDWQTSDGGDIVTEEEFEDFHLELEWKVAENGNSGIIFYVKEDTAKYDYTWNTGLEMQVLDNNGHPDAKIEKHRAGDLYDLIASSPETVKPAGEWNKAEIISDNGQLVFHLNGEKVLETTLWDDNWRQMVAGSKFADMENWGTFRSGKIAIQDHGDNVWYRNIRIKRL
ncbi:3-keto-disaccharide hydrolase [Pontibacter anaerobius]|uniref:DUF1080 domain-containing protein n=1 Tax=Pontibacter anaerobius TaxID=2993940 RepID=A0ABT3REB7_9BACT|nr:DUF1080 domain-containing protein [Pontibacter anaerobius]MCX2739761.1 DUF1080 domain-containing protein [Pontibacter anaerobius]